ncbi:MAG TPA: phosphocarrier protein HPr [Elusimicrobia bacterium]|nr:MAG: phosphocarrier protein HPr [Elusimicrobia bacterium RIFOXYA12_FULL_49_49]OGS09686.1 MAG: phosphocarrier protein HPr [Elusimicrobia bacterium RIFOXYB1_FULL_48_9]OGS15575.1 MAG: phosphocarrier protein HPr [Elusimicrobia bacterium RIFOXYA2_FULL_47_53]OGS26869.1 MAG: phosphocarrier protein HPr [Elusimicrobia bacterium RIFOXYB12_FULL_50_12]OGS30674.1 MAG: phosphocarrier protein HPr [Elusimicrobia bacterium RIFOXYB2_FULL_46_23]HBU68863.1 phosphocarrier protein HPr [Elusimicrobiota bacterium]
MQEKVITIKNKLGLHARPAAMFVQTAARFKSKIKIIKDEQEVDGKSIMGIMTLAASFGTEIKLIVDGADEAAAVEAISLLFESGFGE